MRSTVQLFTAVLATAVALAGLASAAVAHNTAISSQHTMDFTPDVASDRFMGQISSTKDLCERGRSVTLYRVVGDSSVPDHEVATATTDSNGVWSKGIGDAPSGSYYAVAAKKVVQPNRHKHVRKAARTASLSVVPVLEGLSLNPSTIHAGGEATGTVTLSAPAEDDLAVSLESSNASVATVPAAVNVPAGQDLATFTVAGLEAGAAEIRASLDDASATRTLTVNNL